jgi:SAM-dependent methyltransferase
MSPASLFRSGRYSLEWVKDFYTESARWWGPDVRGAEVHAARAATVRRLCGPGPLRILELGSGSGYSAAALADEGHAVTALEFNSTDSAHARELAKSPRKGSLAAFEADFYSAQLDGRFDLVCAWQSFGFGSDADQRRLLRRIAAEWLAPGGCALLDIYCPLAPARFAGTEVRVPPQPGVPDSQEMFERVYFDAVHGRWIIEWEPVADPGQSLAQTTRCYTPADLLLLLEGTGLRLNHAEVDGQPLPWDTAEIVKAGPLMHAYCYLAQFVPV